MTETPPDAAEKADGKARRITARVPAADVMVFGLRGIAIRCLRAGVIRARTVARGVWTLRCDGVRRVGRLLVCWEIVIGAVKCLASNASADTDTDRPFWLASRRHFVERGLLNAQSCLGMHQFQIRMWCAWYHHMALVVSALALSDTMRRRFTDALPLMSFNNVAFDAVHLRGRPDPGTEDMLPWLLLCYDEDMRRECEVWSGSLRFLTPLPSSAK